MSDDLAKSFAFDVAELPGHTLGELLGDSSDAESLFDVFGRDLVTKTILMSPTLSVFHESAKPDERVKPHRHGTLQVDYVLAGELIFGSEHITAGMGYVIPDTLYSWRAGPDGADWIEIHQRGSRGSSLIVRVEKEPETGTFSRCTTSSRSTSSWRGTPRGVDLTDQRVL